MSEFILCVQILSHLYEYMNLSHTLGNQSFLCTRNIIYAQLQERVRI